MLSKSKIKRIGTQLKQLGVSQDATVAIVGCSKLTLGKIYEGKKYDADLIKKLIALRDEKLLEATELESRI